jgi:hypothetical protein
MSTTTEKPPDDLSRMTPRQQVSNRSILRIQQLSDDLRKDLNRMDIFQQLGGVREVLFAAIDHRRSNHQDTWYNFRLCATCGLDEEAIRVLKDDIHSRAAESLFRLAKDAWDPHTSANHTTFLNELENDNKNDQRREKALDQLLIALAVVPYQGVLVSLLEEAFFGKTPEIQNQTQAGTQRKPIHRACFFAPVGNNPGEFSVRNFDCFQIGKLIFKRKWDDFRIDPTNVPPQEGEYIKKLFEDFLLPFTRGAWLRKVGNISTQNTTKSERHDQDVYGFAVPAYDAHCPDEGWRGGMTGWLIVFLQKPSRVKSFFSWRNFWGRKRQLDHSWSHFTDLVRTYVRRVREANIRDLLEDYAEPDGIHEQPREYFLKHLHQVIGFETLASAKAQQLGEEVLKDKVRPLVIPEDTHREQVEQDVLPLPHTCWDGCVDRGKGTTFPPGTRRLCAMFLDELELVRAKREEGQNVARAGFFHQIRNLGASAAEGWLMKGTDTFRNNVANALTDKYADLLDTPWRFVPFPELHRAFGVTLGVWGRTEVFSSRSNLMKDLIASAVDSALACVTTMVFKGAGVEISDDRQAVREKLKFLQLAGENLNASLLESLGHSPDLELVTEGIELASGFKKLLVRIAEETLCHGKLDTATIQLTVYKETCDIKWHNDTRPIEPDDDLHKKLASYNIKATSHGPEVQGNMRGSQVNRKLVERLGGTLKSNFQAGREKQSFVAEGLRLKFSIHQSD